VSTVRLTLIKSPIGYKQDQKDTVQALGLFRMGYSAEREDTRTLRGMVHKVAHLVKLEELPAARAQTEATVPAKRAPRKAAKKAS